MGNKCNLSTTFILLNRCKEFKLEMFSFQKTTTTRFLCLAGIVHKLVSPRKKVCDTLKISDQSRKLETGTVSEIEWLHYQFIMES